MALIRLNGWLETPEGGNVATHFAVDDEGELAAWRLQVFNPFWPDTFSQSQYMMEIRWGRAQASKQEGGSESERERAAI